MLFKKHGCVSIPVVDEQNMIQGVVTIDDILRIASEKNTANMQKIGGMEALDEPYMETPFLELIKKRSRWLVLLFLGEMFTATAMGFPEEEVSKAVVLALFLPLIISSGGNAGSQSSTLIIRAMALGEIKLRDWWENYKTRSLLRACSRVYIGLRGVCKGFYLELFFRHLWRTLAARGGDHFFLFDRGCCVGVHLGR